MIRRLRDAFGRGVSDEEAAALVDAGLADIQAALRNVIDGEAVLARIYAHGGQEMPTAPERGEGDDAAAAVCSRIRMLETAIAAAIKPRGSTSLLGVEYMTIARRFLFELRTGLQAHGIQEEDAFRLLDNTHHSLDEADRILRRQRGMSLQEAVHSRIGDLQQLNSDLLGQLDVIADDVVMLFGHSGDAAPVLVPQH